MKPERWRNLVRLRFSSLAERGRLDEELAKELRFHLDREIEENLAAGMPLPEARRAAMRRLGGVTQIEEECRDMRRMNYAHDLVQDLRYAARTFAKERGFAVLVALTLGLGIGANSAIFSVIDGVLLKKLPYRQPDQIVRVFFSSTTYPKFPLNPFDFRDFRTRSRSFQALAAFTRTDVQLSGTGEPVRLSAFRVTAGYFEVLGIAPALGREFDQGDEVAGNSNSVVLSGRTWRKEFGAAPDIIGRKITLDSQPVTVVGVMPPGTEHPGNSYHALPYGNSVDAWCPFPFEGNPNDRGSHFLEVIGRLKPSVTRAQAQAELNTLLPQIARDHSGYQGWHMVVVELYREIVGSNERLLLVLLGAVILVLMIACANVANLLMARATARQREVAVRSALGAGQSRLMRQMLTESLLIALAGGTLGLLFAAGGVKALVSLLPADFPRVDSIHVNATVLGITLLVALAAGFVFGLVPAFEAARAYPQQGLREGARGSTDTSLHLRLRSVLVVAEVSLASILLAGAGLMLRSFVNLLRLDPGFRPDHVLTANITLPSTEYKTPAAARAFEDSLITNLSSDSGVRYAGIGTDLPWTGYDENAGGFTIEGKTPRPGEEFHGRYHAATPDYFRALGMPLVRGRFFTKADNAGSPQVMIINATMARLYWPHGDALGARITFSDAPKEKDWITVVGIVGDVKDTPTSQGAEPAFWWPLLQLPFIMNGGAMSVATRSDSDASQLANVLRREVHRLNPALAVYDVRLLDQITGSNLAGARFAFFLVGLFAALAVGLAAVGTYGVIAYSVSRRTHEFGLRLALGASRWDVVRLVFARGAALAAIGVAFGLVAGLGLARVLRSLIYEVSPADPLTFGAVALLVFSVAALACYLPARRATEADPMTALRAE